MKQKEVTKTFMMISCEKNLCGLCGLYKNNSALQGLMAGRGGILYRQCRLFINPLTTGAAYIRVFIF